MDTSFFSGGSIAAKHAKANVAQSQTDSVLVAAVADMRIKVLSFRVVVGGTATTVTFNTKGAGAGTAISEAMYLVSGINSGDSSLGQFEPTTAGEALTVTTSAGSTCGIHVTYELVSA